MDEIDAGRIESLTLTVTERCQLRCAYCYVPVDRARTMAPETVDAAVALLARGARGEEATLSFFGGEPTLAMDLCRRAVDGARAGLGDGRRLRVVTPTNGLGLGGEALAWCRDAGVDLAVSLDGADETERRLPDGRPAHARLLPLLPGVLAALPAARVLGRMTVTPANVGRLASNVRALARLGFRRILHLPAFEEAWDDASVAAWEREHRRIGTWLVGAHGAGTRVPDLPAWRAVEERLLLGRRRRPCGAGVRLAAVSTDGGLYPCYRLVFRGDDPKSRLGDVWSGRTNREAIAAFAAFDPNDVRPEDGSCAACPARDGCTHGCPALGVGMLGDLRAVPRIACALMRAQVEAIRPYAAVDRRPARRGAPMGLAAAIVAATVTTTGVAAAACGGSTDSVGQTGSTGGTGASKDAAWEYVPGACAGGAGGWGGTGGAPGLCADGALAGWGGTGGGPGACAGGGGGVGGSGGWGGSAGGPGACAGGGGGVGGSGGWDGGPGLCVDAGGGLCPVVLDGGEDVGEEGDGWGGGGGGICPNPKDSAGGYGDGGLCK